MLATVMNGMLLQQTLAAMKCKSKVLNALSIQGVTEAYSWQKTLHYFEEGNIVIFVGGTGNPYFTTDSAAALRACEIGAEVVLKGTKVDGVYDKDPIKYRSAKHFPTLLYDTVIKEQLDVMDLTAVVLCWENKIPIHVFNIFKKGSLFKAVCEKKADPLSQEINHERYRSNKNKNASNCRSIQGRIKKFTH